MYCAARRRGSDVTKPLHTVTHPRAPILSNPTVPTVPTDPERPRAIPSVPERPRASPSVPERPRARHEEDDEAALGRTRCVTRCFAPQVVCVWRRKISLPYRAAARQGMRTSRTPTARIWWGGGSRQPSPHATGPKNELRWHDGFVVEYGEIQDDEGGAGTVHQYSLFFPIDAAGCECTTPFNGKDLCFRKPHLSDPKASEREMSRARAALNEAAE